MPRHFLTGEELTSEELDNLLRRAEQLKRDRLASRALTDHTVALIFQKPSTRTRVSFEVGVVELGGYPLVLREGEMQLSRGESAPDTARVLSRFVDVIAIRTGPQAILEELAAHSEVPVINMLTDEHHPCQALADLLTLRERFGKLEGLRLVYVGDGNNMAHSLMVLGAIAGVEVIVASPPELSPDEDIMRLARKLARNGASIEVTGDAVAAAHGAHALYTDVWVSMGDEDSSERRRILEPYRLDERLMESARDDAIALHCLPAHPGEEISETVLYGEHSAVFDQAENRLHAQKALLEFLVAE